MKNLVTLLLAVILFAACTKKEEGAGTTPCLDGTIHFVNSSVNPYNIEIDNKPVSEIAKYSMLDHTVFNGTYYIKATQVSGFKVTPTVREYYVTIKGCDTISVVIPKAPHDSM